MSLNTFNPDPDMRENKMVLAPNEWYVIQIFLILINTCQRDEKGQKCGTGV